jgi:two-component system, response regulator PdtaR
MPENLTLYDVKDQLPAAGPGFIPSKRSLRTRLEHWISGQHH